MSFVKTNGMRGKMIQLPNGDLWRGHTLVQSDERPDTLSLEGGEKPEDVIAEILTSQKGEMLSCTMCGQQYSRKQLNELREHIEKLHPASSKPLTNAEVALAQGMDTSDVELLGAIVLEPLK